MLNNVYENLMTSTTKKSTQLLILKPSNVSNATEELENEEQEVTAQITIPRDGGWGWVVVFAAFFSIFILDGVAYSVGAMLTDIAKDFLVSDSLVALVNSTAVSLYFMGSPLASALINRFGFRACAMSGSCICSLALFISYFVPNYPYFFCFYGLLSGIGYALINMSSGLVVGFYFEKLRSVALAISSCGSSIGVMSLFPLNAHLVKLGGWRTTTLLHSGLFGLTFFFGMAYRPLLSFTVTRTDTEEDFLKKTIPRETVENKMTTSRVTLPNTERMFTISNTNFPTAAEILKDIPVAVIPQDKEPGPSTGLTSPSKSTIILTPHTADGFLSQRQLKQVKSLISDAEASNQGAVRIVHKEEHPKQRGFFRRLFHWEPHEPQTRPLYRDDIFYEGKLEQLPEYQKSMMDTQEGKTGLEYHMAVTRTTAVKDLEDQRGVFTHAVRRVLATMMDPTLLKRKSFLFMCISGFLTYLGFLVPYVYLQQRNENAGINAEHCTLFISAIGISNALGRLVLGSLASKIDPLKLFSFSCVVAGISTIASNASFNVYFQYAYCCTFGFFIASVACLRSIILVSLYGLDKLTNATGMMLIFLGLGNIVSTPLAGVIKNNFGFALAFYVAGSFITLSGFALIPVGCFAKRENKAMERQASKDHKSIDTNESKEQKTTEEATPPRERNVTEVIQMINKQART